MKKYETNRLRNIAIIAHGKAGKTTLAEAMLFDGGVTDRLGRVDDGSSVMDFEPEEIKRSLSISSSFNHLEWNKHKINIIDTPGDANFIIDTKNSLQAVDGVVIVVDAVSGVEVQTEKVWEYASQFGLSRLFFISKMERERASFSQSLADIQKILTPKAIPLTLPIGSEGSFAGVVDLMAMKAFYFENNSSGKIREDEIPSNLQAEVKNAKEKLVEVIAESDDALLEKYLEGQELSPEELSQGLRKGVEQNHFPHPLRLRLEKHGNSTSPRCHHSMSAFPDRSRARQGYPSSDQGRGKPAASGRGTFFGLRFQNHC